MADLDIKRILKIQEIITPKVGEEKEAWLRARELRIKKFLEKRAAEKKLEEQQEEDKNEHTRTTKTNSRRNL